MLTLSQEDISDPIERSRMNFFYTSIHEFLPSLQIIYLGSFSWFEGPPALTTRGLNTMAGTKSPDVLWTKGNAPLTATRKFIRHAITLQSPSSELAMSDTNCPALHAVCSRGTQLARGSISLASPGCELVLGEVNSSHCKQADLYSLGSAQHCGVQLT